MSVWKITAISAGSLVGAAVISTLSYMKGKKDGYQLGLKDAKDSNARPREQAQAQA